MTAPSRDRGADADPNAEVCAVPGRSVRPTEMSARRRDGAERSPLGAGFWPQSSAEWITLLFSSSIVLGLLALTSYFYLTMPATPAVVEVQPRLSEVYQAGERFYLPVTVRNVGGKAGEEVRVRVTVTESTGRSEQAEFMIQFLAGGSSTQAVVAFASDPRQATVEAGVTSYLEP